MDGSPWYGKIFIAPLRHLSIPSKSPAPDRKTRWIDVSRKPGGKIAIMNNNTIIINNQPLDKQLTNNSNQLHRFHAKLHDGSSVPAKENGGDCLP